MGKNLRENTNLCLEIMNSRRQAKETLVTWYKFWRKREENAEKNYGETSIKKTASSLLFFWLFFAKLLHAKSKRASREKWRKPEKKK